MTDEHKRSVMKAITYRIAGAFITILIVHAFTGHWTLSLGAGVLDVILKTAIYFVHERVWNRIRYGTG